MISPTVAEHSAAAQIIWEAADVLSNGEAREQLLTQAIEHISAAGLAATAAMYRRVARAEAKIRLTR